VQPTGARGQLIGSRPRASADTCAFVRSSVSEPLSDRVSSFSNCITNVHIPCGSRHSAVVLSVTQHVGRSLLPTKHRYVASRPSSLERHWMSGVSREHDRVKLSLAFNQCRESQRVLLQDIYFSHSSVAANAVLQFSSCNDDQSRRKRLQKFERLLSIQSAFRIHDEWFAFSSRL
jgi:hypothetical protein